MLQGVFSAASSESFDSDPGDVLPMASPAAQNPSSSAALPTNDGVARGGREGEDRKWFQALDERYLLLLFSNATASQTFHARKAHRTQSLGQGSSALAIGSGSGTPAEMGSNDEGGQELELGPATEFTTSSTAVELSRIARGLPSPVLRSSNNGEN